MFKEEARQLVLKPTDLTVSALSPDEDNRERSKVILEFILPRGAYATLLVKRLFADPPKPMWSAGGDRRPRRDNAPRGRPKRKRPPWTNQHD